MHKSKHFFKSIKTVSISLWLLIFKFLKMDLWEEVGVWGVRRSQKKKARRSYYSFEAEYLPKHGAHSFGLGMQPASCSNSHSMEVTDTFQIKKSWPENV